MTQLDASASQLTVRQAFSLQQSLCVVMENPNSAARWRKTALPGQQVRDADQGDLAHTSLTPRVDFLIVALEVDGTKIRECRNSPAQGNRPRLLALTIRPSRGTRSYRVFQQRPTDPADHAADRLAVGKFLLMIRPAS